MARLREELRAADYEKSVRTELLETLGAHARAANIQVEMSCRVLGSEICSLESDLHAAMKGARQVERKLTEEAAAHEACRLELISQQAIRM